MNVRRLISRAQAIMLLVLLGLIFYAVMHNNPKDDPCRRADGTFDSEVCDGPDEK